MNSRLKVTELVPGKYDSSEGKWRKASSNNTPKSISKLRCVTYNIWFDPLHQGQRMLEISNILKASKADIIGLQEVTPDAFQFLKKQAWVRKKYHLSDLSGNSIHPYGVILLSRFGIKKAKLVPIPSLRYRQVLIARLQMNGQSLTTSVVHLESQKDGANLRALQMEILFSSLKNEKNVLLMGDFNFDSANKAENKRLDSRYIDLWPKLKPEQEGFTVDTDINLMRLSAKGTRKQARFDRILLRSDDKNWVPQKIKLLGTKAWNEKRPDIFPSDHFGLRAKFKWKGGK